MKEDRVTLGLCQVLYGGGGWVGGGGGGLGGSLRLQANFYSEINVVCCVK